MRFCSRWWIAVVSGLVSGIAPSLLGPRRIAETLKEGGRGSSISPNPASSARSGWWCRSGVRLCFWSARD